MDVIYKAEQQQLELTFSSKVDLLNSHMPFIKQVGLFVPGNFLFEMGDKVNLNLKLLFIKMDIKIIGMVVWIMPKNSRHHHYQQASGIGIQFDLSDNEMHENKISTELLPLFIHKRSCES